MTITPTKINAFNFLKLPLAWISGLRVKEVTQNSCTVKIKHRWINQNPFKSMFWAAQGMAAEMTTGVLVMNCIKESGQKVSMLVTHQNANFFKKATGKITFVCNNGREITNAIMESKRTGEGQVVVLKSEGINKEGVKVSEFEFHWSLRVKH